LSFILKPDELYSYIICTSKSTSVYYKIKEFLETNYPQGRAIEAPAFAGHDLSSQDFMTAKMNCHHKLII